MKINLSIRSQIIFLSSGLVIVSFLVLIPFMIKNFTDDKSAYLFDQILDISLAAQEKTDQSIANLENQAKLLTLESRTQNLPANVLSYSIYKDHSNNFALKSAKTNLLAVSKYSLDNKIEKGIAGFDVRSFQNMSKRGSFSDYALVSGVPIVTVYIHSRGDLHAFKFVAGNIEESYANNKRYQNVLLSNNGYTIQNSVGITVEPALITKVAKAAGNSGVLTTDIKSEKYLVGYAKHPKREWQTLTLIPQAEIFGIVKKLIYKIIGFAGIVLSIAMFLGALIARNIINPIGALVTGTQEYTKKNYAHRIQLPGKNEFTELSDSFNALGAEILRYIEEVKEKSRMENELAVAQLVQSSFFPEKKIVTKNFSVLGHYASAAECGGDWWGTKVIGDKTLLFIADATGHGVPAALITATANCVGNLLPQICEEHPELLDSPAKILDYFNLAVFKAGGKILMTFFIGVYDKKTKTLKYANASHNPPILYRYSDKEPEKGDLALLLDAEGPRLGHVEKPAYTQGTVQMNDQDVLVMFTDGLIEAENSEHKPYGDRRFMKSVMKHVKSEPDALLTGLLKDAEEFLQGSKPDDDVTMIIAKRELT